MKEGKERVQYMSMSNTLMRLTQKLGNYDRILLIIERIRKLDSWNSDKLSPKVKPVLRKFLLEVTKEVRQLEDIYWYDRFPGTPAANARASQDSHPKINDFLAKALK